ncbi:MAG TPA: FtsX-like permease family protein [Jatrophihabitantaceae bacterium]|nr:FtsX-like permease family protein [Jatrophihabitantaceae bacterium]
MTSTLRPAQVPVRLPRAQGNPLVRVGFRNLRAHKVRLLLTVISVLLGTAFVAGSFVFTDTLKHSFNAIFATGLKGIDTRIEPQHDYDPGVPANLAATIRKLPGVAKVSPQISLPAVVVDSHGKRLQTGGAPSEAGGWTPASESVTPPATFAAGTAPTTPNEVVINQGAANKAHLKVGDHLHIVLANAGSVDVRLAGIYRTASDTGGYVGVRFTQQEAKRLLTDGTHVSLIDVAAAPGVSEQTLTARIKQVVPPDLKVRTGTQARDDATHGIASALSFVNYILLAFGIIGLIVGTFIIFNTFSMLIAQRLRELALLRAVGADRKQIRRSVLLEAGMVGLIGSVLGLAGGVGLAYGLRALLDALDLGLPSGALVITTRTVLVTVLLGLAATLLAAYAPARRAAQTPPVAAMRAEFASTSAASLRRRSLIGLVVGALALVATIAGLNSSSAGSGASLAGLGLVGMVASAMLLSPVLARLLIVPLGRLIGRPFGAAGRLSRTNAVRHPRRTAATAFALTLGLVLVSGIAVIGSSMKASINAVFDNNVTADYILSSQTAVSVPEPAVLAAERVPGVGSMTQLYGLSATVDGQHRVGMAVDGPLTSVMKLTGTKGAVAPTGHTMIVSKTRSEKPGWGLGSKHVLTAPGVRPITETVGGVFDNNQLLDGWLVSGQVYRQLTQPTDRYVIVGLVKAAPGANLAALRTGLENATNDFYVIDVQDRDQYEGQIAGQVNGLLGLLYGLLALAIVIAILGIVNTLALSVVERRREIGMLRAVGMQRRQVRRTIYLESLLIAVFGAVLGLVLGLAYGSLFTHTLRDQGLNRLSIPWGQALTFLVVAGVVGVLAALWPGIRAARTSPLQAISDL